MATLSSPTLQKLIHNVRALLNQPDRLNSFWSDEELTTYLNDAVTIYFCEYAQMNEGHFNAVADLDITANQDTVTLPSDFFELRTVYKKVSDGYVALPYRNRTDEGYSTQGGTSPSTFFPQYYFRGNSLALRPIPNFDEVDGLRIEYIQLPDTMINGGDVLTNQISPIFRQLVEAYAIYKAKLKESLVNGTSVHANAEAHMGTLYKQFQQAAQVRSKSPTFVKPFNPEIEGF
jgi:hypothetical protein